MIKKNEYIYDKPKRSINKKAVLYALIALLSVVFVVSLILFRINQDNKAAYDTFVAALDNVQYAEAMDIYYEIQRKATDLNNSLDNRLPMKEVQLAIEATVGERLGVFVERVMNGGNLTDEEKENMSQLKFLTSMHIVPELRSLTEALLEGEVSPETWEHVLRNFLDVRPMTLFISDLMEQKDSLVEKVADFKLAGELEKGENWQLTWQTWESLATDDKGSRFARDYASFRLLTYQRREYSNLMNLTSDMIEAEQYYTAHNLLKLMYKVFPERKELSERLTFCDDKLPVSLKVWDGLVDVFAVRPLVARPELAFSLSIEEAYARSALITTSEFENFLAQLYQNDYVLVSPRQIEAWPERHASFVVPNGKKPVILLFDSWQYSVLNQVAGTASRLYMEEGAIIAEAGDAKGRHLDAIPILEDFLAEHPDFSFDGAKAVIALNCDESLFGFTISQEEVAGSQEAWARVGEVYPDVTEEELLVHREEVSGLMNYLTNKGWDFASAGYVGYDTANLNQEELSREIDQWASLMTPWLDEVHCFVFPNGSHVYQNEEALSFMLNRGLKILFGQGPKPYHYFARKYVHFDRIAVNGGSLSDPLGYFSGIINTSEILDYTLR